MKSTMILNSVKVGLLPSGDEKSSRDWTGSRTAIRTASAAISRQAGVSGA